MMKVKWSSASSVSGSFLTLRQGADFLKKLEVTQMKKQIEVLLTFMPDEILSIPTEKLGDVHNFVGVLLFADVSGFTPLTEKYNKSGKGGIYRLTATLNAYIGAIIEVIYFFGGDVFKFSGDAFLALWKADSQTCLYEVIHRVIVCALFIQKHLGYFETEVNVPLKVKLAISCGNLTISVIGDERFRQYIVLGQPVNDVKAAEHVSTSGDVVLSPSAWGHLAEDNYDVTYANSGGHVKVWGYNYKTRQKEKEAEYNLRYREIADLCAKHIELRNMLNETRKSVNENLTDSYLIENFVKSLPPRRTSKMAVQRWILNDLKPFIVKPVLNQVEEKQSLQYLTEMREITIQFVNIVPMSYDDVDRLVLMVDSAYKIVCNVTVDVLGVVNKVNLFDKDAMMLVLFGMKGVKHELESQNALKSAFKIRKEIMKLDHVKSVSVGITYGLVYCGVVGHPLRSEYTVIGGAVNKAARLMCAYEHKVTCDYETYAHSKLSSTYFQLQQGLKLKGIESVGHIFEYNENFEEIVHAKQTEIPLVGRDDEMDFISEIVEGKSDVPSVLFRAEPKSGKTFLLEHCYDFFKITGATCVFISLTGGFNAPYNCIRQIYQQIYDNRDINTEKFQRILWNFNEISQEKMLAIGNENVSDRKTSIIESFSDICNIGDTVVFVDNAENIDSKSFETITATLDRPENKLKVIFFGTFDETKWDTLFKFSLSSKIRVVELAPIEPEYVPNLICHMLKVDGVPKKLCTLIERSCEGRPGWIESCLLKLVNNGGIKIEYVLLDESLKESLIFPFGSFAQTKKQIVPIVILTKDENVGQDLTLAAISLDLFDSFTPYEQLVIKTGAVLGEMFTRHILVVMLKYPKVDMFTRVIMRLFQEEVFECGSKYISSGGRFNRNMSCACYMERDPVDTDKFPKYAHCLNLHFKNKTLRSVAYELIPANQRKELHLRITEVLETQSNLCPNCLRDNTTPILNFHTFATACKLVENDSGHKQSKSGGGGGQRSKVVFNEYSTKALRDVIRFSVQRTNEEESKYEDLYSRSMSFSTANRTIWDPTLCFCLEILTRVHSDLVFHSTQAGHTSKTIFFLYQNGLILSLLDENESAIELLKEASELSVSHIYEESRVKPAFARFIFVKTCSLLAEIYFSLNNLQAAKNYCVLTLRQFNIPMVSSHNVRFLSLVKYRLSRGTFLDDSIGKCLSLISHIFANEGRWNIAISLAETGLKLVRKSNPDIGLLCDVYSTALDLHSLNGNKAVCEELGQEAVRLFGNNLSGETFSVAKLMQVVFHVKARSGRLLVATRLGFRIFEMNRTLHAYVFHLEIVPTLCYLLMLQRRLDDAVFTLSYLRNLGTKYNDERGELIYYCLSLVILNETNFYVETLEEIESFADIYFEKNMEKSVFKTLENTLLVYLFSSFLREGKTTKMARWKRVFSPDFEYSKNFFNILNHLKYTESAMLIYRKDSESKNDVKEFEPAKIGKFMKCLRGDVECWRVFKCRYLHLKAYEKKLAGGKRQVNRLLRKADLEADCCGNSLEKCWLILSRNCWKDTFSNSQKKDACSWKFSNAYNDLQWSQMMFVLPNL